MRVGVFCDDFDPHIGGGSSLTKVILKELSEYKGTIEFVLLYSNSFKEKHSFNIGFEAINVVEETCFKDVLGAKIEKLGILKWIDRRYDRIAKKYNIDIFWFCHPIYAGISVPYIYTVWDLGHRVVPFFPEVSLDILWITREKMYQRMIPNASWVLVGNTTGKKEVMDNYSISGERIRIAPFPVADFCKGDEAEPPFKLPDYFFFYPAQFWAHKNHVVILHALSYLKKQHNVKLIVYFTGSDKGNKDYIIKMSECLGISDQVVVTGFISDKELKYMYTHATAMIFASFLGPNNMPPIESAFLGCPVILSDIPGHREQMGEAALYFDPTDEIKLGDCMLKLLDDSFREDLISKEKILSDTFSKIKYCDPVFGILEEFKKYRRCWE